MSKVRLVATALLASIIPVLAWLFFVSPTPAAGASAVLNAVLSASTPAPASVQAGKTAHPFTEYVFSATGGDIELTRLRIWAQGAPRDVDPRTRPVDYLRTVRLVNAVTGEVLGTVATMTHNGSDYYQDYAYSDVTLATPLRIAAGARVTLTLSADIDWDAVGDRQYHLGFRNASDVTAREVATGQSVALQWPLVGGSFGNWMTILPTLKVARAATALPAQSVQAGRNGMPFAEYVFEAGNYLDMELTTVRVWAEGAPEKMDPLARPADYLHNVRLVNAVTGQVLGTSANMIENPTEMYRHFAYADVVLASPLVIPAGTQVTLTLQADIDWDALSGRQYRLGFRYWTDIVGREAASDQRLTVKWPVAVSSWGNWMTIQPSLVVERATTSPVAQFVAKGSAAVAFSEYVLQAGSYLDVELTSVRVWAQGQPRNSNPLTRPQDYLRNVQVVDASTGAVLGTLATMTLSGSDMYQDYAYGDVALASPLTIRAGRQVTLTLRADVSATAINGYQYRLGLRYWSDPVAREALSDQRLTIKWPFAISSWGNWMTVSNLSATPTPTSTPTSTPTPVVVPKPRFQVTLGPNTSYAWVRDLTLTITALNVDGSVNTGYTGKIDINPTLSLSGLSLNPGYWEDYTFTAANQGQVTFSQFGASVAGALAVTVVDRADNSMTGTSGSVQVRPVYLAASFSPPRIHAGVPGLTLTIQALDAPGGNLVTGYRGELDINPPVGKTGLPQSASMYDPDYAFQATDGGQKHFPNLVFYLDGTH